MNVCSLSATTHILNYLLDIRTESSLFKMKQTNHFPNSTDKKIPFLNKININLSCVCLSCNAMCVGLFREWMWEQIRWNITPGMAGVSEKV